MNRQAKNTKSVRNRISLRKARGWRAARKPIGFKPWFTEVDEEYKKRLLDEMHRGEKTIIFPAR